MMKKIFAVLLALCLLFTLASCKKKPVETEETTTQASTTEEPTTETTEEPTEETTVPNQALEVLQYGAFNGLFVEDGSDKEVESVACILVKNHSGAYIDYGKITAKIGEQMGEFILTGIPADGIIWVMESTGMTIGAEDSFTYVDQVISQLRTEEMIDSRVQVSFSDGAIVLTNLSEEDLTDVKVYYKQIHEDGNLLGGITYTLTAEALSAGQSTALISAHSRQEGCYLVRLSCGGEES